MQCSEIHQLVGFFTLIIGSAGLIMSTRFRRPAVFRIKLWFVFIIPLVSGIGSVFAPEEFFGVFQSIANISFMFLISMLYWREVKAYMTSAGYHKTKLSNYIDESLDVVWAKDLDARYTYVNKAFMNIVRLEEKDILGKKEEDLKANFLRNTVSLHVCRSPIYNNSDIKRLTGYLYIGREFKLVKNAEIFFDNDYYIMQNDV